MSTKTHLDDIVKKLHAVSGPDCNGWFTALCPFHEDQHKPNLRFRETGFRCMACGEKGSLKKLAEKLDITGENEPVGLTLAVLADAKGLSAEFLRRLGVADGFVGSGQQRVPCVDIPYIDQKGEIVGLHKRLRLTGNPRFVWRRGDHVSPYGLWRLTDAREAGQVVLVEGESDCWTLWEHNIPALGLPGATTWNAQYADLLQGVDVVLWREPDTGGEALLKAIMADLPDARIVEAPQETKDPSALYLLDRVQFREKFRALLQTGRPSSQFRMASSNSEASELYPKAKPALEDPALLHLLVKATEALGHVDDRQNVAALHLVLVSRFFDRLPSVVIKGSSAEGKSHLAHKVLEVHPTSAAYVLSALSEHALAYSQEPLAHRFLILEEAAALDNRFTTYLVRSLLSEGRLRYETVEKTREGLRPRLIQREGPTGLICTTTAHSLDAETETRMLTLETQETPAHLRHILNAIASRRNQQFPTGVPETLTAALRWLELAGNRKVTVPFAGWLAEQLPIEAMASRLTRDFDGILAVIGASALLHQCQRQRDETGRIIANVGDYGIAITAIGRSFELVMNDAVTQRQREVSNAVESMGEASVRAIARKLGMHPSNASRHLRALAAKGFIRKTGEETTGKSAGYVISEPLPEERSVLPPWQQLAAAFPQLAADWVDPLTGAVCVCLTPSNTPQHCNTPDNSDTYLAAPSVAALRPESQGITHTHTDRRRISL